MYNEKILNQLDNLKYLGALKGSNVSIVSKPNEFGDAVKFYAQINKDDVIQKISYRASGCTHFLVFCNYFCSLVEGKTVKSALSVKTEKLENFVELDESKTHIISIILDAFALLIKRYRKGVEKGKIEPCEVQEKSEDTPKSRPMTSKSFTKVVGEIIKNIELSHKNDNQISVSKSSDTLSKLVDLKNKKHTEIEEKKVVDKNELVIEKKEKISNVKVEPVVEQNNQTLVEEKPVEKKTTKRAKNEEPVVTQSKDIDKDELLENLIDEGIFLDDFLANNNQKEEVKTEKSKKTSKKSTAKKEEKTVELNENEKSIEELNEEITGLIDIFEEDEVAPAKEEQKEEVVQEVEVSKVEEPNKEKKTATKKVSQPKEKKASKSTEKKVSNKIDKIDNNDEPKENQDKSNHLLALKSMLNNRPATRELKQVEEKKSETKINNLTAMLNKMNNKGAEDKKVVEKEQPVTAKATQENRLSSLKMSLASINNKNENSTKNSDSKQDKKVNIKKASKSEKVVEKKEKVKTEKVKPEKVKVEKTKVEKTKPVKKEEKKKVEKKVAEKKEKQPKEPAPKKAKKNSYDMEYETIDYGSKKGLFSWLKRK